MSLSSPFLSPPSSCPEGSESLARESVVLGHTSVSGMVPIARFSEEEKRVSVIKAPHYEGIGPVDDSGIPIAIRTVRSRPQRAPRVGMQPPVHESGLLSAVSSFGSHIKSPFLFLSPPPSLGISLTLPSVCWFYKFAPTSSWRYRCDFQAAVCLLTLYSVIRVLKSGI